MSAWPGDPWGAQPCGPTACTSMPQPGGPPAAAAPVWPSLARHDGAPLQPDACAAGAPPGEELLEGIGGLAQFLQSHGGGLRRPGFRLPPLVPGALSPAGSAGLEGSAQLPLHGAGSADLGRWGSLEHPSPASVACAGQAPVAVAVPAPWLAGAASGSGAGAGAALWDVDLDLDALLGSGALDLDIDFGELLGAADAGAAAAAGVPAQSAGQAVSSGACYSTQPTRTQTAGGGRRGGRTAGAQAGGGRTPCGESSKRFRERRRAKAQEVQEKLEATAAAVEQERAAMKRIEVANSMLASLVEYQQAMQEALEAASEGELPYHKVPAEMAALLREFDVADSELLSFDDILRFSPAGYTDNQGPDGRVRDAPPLEMVVREWAETVSTLQQLLEDAAATGRALADRLGQRALRDAAGSVRIVVPLEGEGLPWGVIAQHAQQHSSRRHIWRIREVPDGAPEVSGQEEFGGGSGRSSSRDSQATISSSGRGGSGICQSCGSDFESAQSPADLLPAYHSSSQIPSAAASPQPAPQQAAQQRGHPATPAAASGPAARAALGVAPGAGGCNDIEADLSRLLAGMAITPEQEAAAIAAATATLEAAGVTLGGGGGAPSSALSEGGGAAAGAESRGSAAQGEASDSEGTAALVRRQLVVTALRGSQPWGLVDGGMVVWQAEGAYCFRGETLKTITYLFRRQGALLWQQALLFPDLFRRLSIARVDAQMEQEGSVPMAPPCDMPGQLAAAQAAALDLEVPGPPPAHWDRVVAGLQLKPFQMKELARLYHEYLSKVAAARERRVAAVARLTEVQLRIFGAGAARTAHEHAQQGLELKGVTDVLAQAVLAEHVAYSALLASLVRVLHYPVQKIKLMILSRPYFCQVDQVAAAAARVLRRGEQGGPPGACQ